MGQIPADATLWDCGDWITWHRKAQTPPEPPCPATEDASARLTLLKVGLVRAARSYFDMTGHHLGIFQQIAEAHAAHHYGLPLGQDAVLREAGILLVTLSPDADSRSIAIDLSHSFTSVLVVKISNSIEVESRMITRRRLGEKGEGSQVLKWRNLPVGR